MPEASPSKFVVQAGWDDVPHLDKKTREELLGSSEAHLVGARTEGIPSLGAGAVYQIELNDILVDPFQIPEHWAKVYALDVGWNRTAALWGAHDRDTDILYIYTEHYRAKAEPSVHVTAINARGKWIPGVVDPASVGAGQRDGKRLIVEYQSLGLNLTVAENSVEAGIQMVTDRLSTGRLIIFRSCRNFQNEYRIYKRNEDGLIVKVHDHLMDCLRYLVISGIPLAETRPVPADMGQRSRSSQLSKAGY